MAELTPQPDGSAQVTVTQGEAAGLKAVASHHLPVLQRAVQWLGKDVVPEVADAADFLASLAAQPAQGTTLAVSPAEAQYLRGLLGAYAPEFQGVLAVVESPVVRGLLTLAKSLL